MPKKPRFDVAATVQTCIKLTPGQNELLKKMAKDHGMTVKDFVLSKVGIL